MHRKIWMFPRNKRRIRPLETALFLKAMVVASKSGATWSGNQNQQNLFAELLEEYGLKGGSRKRDANSGGARTYAAQLSFLGLLYKDSETGISLTQAGADAVELKYLADTFVWQILKVQYPSLYSAGHNVNIDPRIKIRPFVLLLDLMQDAELKGLTDVDMMVPVVFGHNPSTFDECKKKILLARQGGIASVLPDGEYIRTAKTMKDTPYRKRLEDIRDIANTFKNVLQGAGMVQEQVIEVETIRWFITPSIVPILKEVKELPLVDFERLQPLQAQLQYGLRKGAAKDTRRVLMPATLPVLDTISGVIYQRFLDMVDLPATQKNIDDFAKDISQQMGITRQDVIKALHPILNSSATYVNQRLIELSKAGTTKEAEAFEKHVAKIFEVDFGFTSTWTGRLKREGIGGFMDVFVVETDRNKCGIIDTKSTNVYDLPHEDMAKAITTYIGGASELYGSKNYELSFVAYISHLIAPNAKNRAMEIWNARHIPVGLVSACGLNSMRDNPLFKGKTRAVTDLLSASPVNIVN